MLQVVSSHGKKPELVRDPSEVPAPADELPVVARLVVEIRSDGRRTIARGAMEDVSDGRRTIARGAMEDVTAGQQVAVEARGDSPLQLAMGLARAIVRGPMFARAAARGLLRPFRKR